MDLVILSYRIQLVKAVPATDKRPRESFCAVGNNDLRWERNLAVHKRLMSGGPLITKEDKADTNSRFSIAPFSQTFGISCSNNQFTDCSNVKLGEERGNAAKAEKSRIISRLILTITDFNRRLVGLMVQWHQYIGRLMGMEKIG